MAPGVGLDDEGADVMTGVQKLIRIAEVRRKVKVFRPKANHTIN